MNWINEMFEAQLQWYYDSALFYINGRDVTCIILGLILGIVLAYLVLLVEALEEERIRK